MPGNGKSGPFACTTCIDHETGFAFAFVFVFAFAFAFARREEVAAVYRNVEVSRVIHVQVNRELVFGKLDV
jgi:hypothetical protein